MGSSVRHFVTVPKLGDMVTEVVIIEWLCSEGDEVGEGQALLRVETDKVEAEIPSPLTGRIVEQLVSPDDEVSVGARICVLET
jgi:2-oxoglutarate dehydrogenase E2 component (dihydrolipoamide succinyltransferase)